MSYQIDAQRFLSILVQRGLSIEAAKVALELASEEVRKACRAGCSSEVIEESDEGGTRC